MATESCVYGSLRALFIALNDESASVRALAIRLAGRLAPRNPALVLPTLRNHLQQLLADMERSPDSRQREGELLSRGSRLKSGHAEPIACYFLALHLLKERKKGTNATQFCCQT